MFWLQRWGEPIRVWQRPLFTLSNQSSALDSVVVALSRSTLLIQVFFFTAFVFMSFNSLFFPDVLLVFLVWCITAVWHFSRADHYGNTTLILHVQIQNKTTVLTHFIFVIQKITKIKTCCRQKCLLAKSRNRTGPGLFWTMKPQLRVDFIIITVSESVFVSRFTWI